MLSDEVAAEIEDWSARKFAQWERVAKTVDPAAAGAHLQLARHGQEKSTFMLVFSSDDFYEAVVFGQLPQVHKVPKNPKRPVTRQSDWREAAEHEKPRAKRRIDLSDGEIDQVLAKWRGGVTALGLPFVTSVWRRDGEEVAK